MIHVPIGATTIDAVSSRQAQPDLLVCFSFVNEYEEIL